MTKRHFEAAATICQGFSDTPGAWLAMRTGFERLFEQFNPAFDQARFRRACEAGANVRARPTRASCIE